MDCLINLSPGEEALMKEFGYGFFILDISDHAGGNKRRKTVPYFAYDLVDL